MGEHSISGLIIEGVRRQLDASGRWMAWNLVLAMAPWVLAVVLFRRSRRPGAAWICGLGAWFLLLPNAAYVLTDIIHLPAAVRREPSDTTVLLVVFPLYAAFWAVGFVAYSDSLRRLSGYAVGRGWVADRRVIELAVHAVCAVAIYLGRIHRLNSWDVVFQPLALLDGLLAAVNRPLAGIGIATMFVALTVGHLVTRPVLQAAYATRWAGGSGRPPSAE